MSQGIRRCGFDFPFCLVWFGIHLVLLMDFFWISGVEKVITDCRSHKVVVKGEKAGPLKVLARVQRKSHIQV